MSVVYRHRRLDNMQPFYIGIGKEEKRAYSKFSRNNHWKNVVNKHNYIVDILASGLSYDDAKELEILLITEYGRIDNKTGILVNMTDGGDGALGNVFNLGKTPSKETRIKISESNKGKKVTKEARCKMSKSHTGMNHSEETKKKISESGKGKKYTEERKLNMKLGQIKRRKNEKL